jgi:hypothetical protein
MILSFSILSSWRAVKPGQQSDRIDSFSLACFLKKTEDPAAVSQSDVQIKTIRQQAVRRAP